MRREHLNPPGLFHHPAFTRIVSIDGPRRTIYFAGQTSTDEQNIVVGKGDYVAQYRQIMKNLTVALTAAGATWNDVVFKRQYTLDIEKYRTAANDPGNPRYWDPEQPPTVHAARGGVARQPGVSHRDRDRRGRRGASGIGARVCAGSGEQLRGLPCGSAHRWTPCGLRRPPLG